MVILAALVRGLYFFHRPTYPFHPAHCSQSHPGDWTYIPLKRNESCQARRWKYNYGLSPIRTTARSTLLWGTYCGNFVGLGLRKRQIRFQYSRDEVGGYLRRSAQRIGSDFQNPNVYGIGAERVQHRGDVAGQQHAGWGCSARDHQFGRGVHRADGCSFAGDGHGDRDCAGRTDGVGYRASDGDVFRAGDCAERDADEFLGTGREDAELDGHGAARHAE